MKNPKSETSSVRHSLGIIRKDAKASNLKQIKHKAPNNIEKIAPYRLGFLLRIAIVTGTNKQLTETS
jgi:hypothetical protein